MVYRHLIWPRRFKRGRKRKTDVLHKNKKLPSVTLFIKLSIESEDLDTAIEQKIIIVLYNALFRAVDPPLVLSLLRVVKI